VTESQETFMMLLGAGAGTAWVAAAAAVLSWQARSLDWRGLVVAAFFWATGAALVAAAIAYRGAVVRRAPADFDRGGTG
jgi:hypothetical protein